MILIWLNLFIAELSPSITGRDRNLGRYAREGGTRRGEGDNLTLYSYHQNDSCIKMGSDKSHFNVSLMVRDSHKAVLSLIHI